MSRTVNVVVLCPNARRQSVKVTPNSSILQILEEACGKQALNPDDFDLCHYNKPLDLSLPIRFANIPNNALLELRATQNSRKESVITVGLQLESGERIMKDFVPANTVYEVIQQCLSQSANVHAAENMEPVCIYMRQKLTGEALKTTTLRNLGLTNGAAAFRLMYRIPEALDDQAHISTPLSKTSTVESLRVSPDQSLLSSALYSDQSLSNFATVNPINVCETNTTELPTDELQEHSVDRVNTDNQSEKNYAHLNEKKARIDSTIKGSISYAKNADKMDLETEVNERSSNLNIETDEFDYLQQSMEVDTSPVDQDDSTIDVSDIKYIGERHAVLYNLDDITSVKKADLPDEFFQLTIKDVKYLMAGYKKTRDELENQPLLTSQQRQQQLLKTLSHYKQTVIRIYFPEKLVLQAVFLATEKVQDILDFIRKFLVDINLNFYLYVTPPKEKLKPVKTLLEAMLIPAAVVYFGSECYCTHYLKMDLREKISDPRAASLAASESRKTSFSSTPLEILIMEEENENNLPSTSSDLPASKPQISQNMPKWLKLSKK